MRYAVAVLDDESLRTVIDSRFPLVDGQPSFRVGAGRNETADVVVEITADAALRLNTLRTAEPGRRSSVVSTPQAASRTG